MHSFQIIGLLVLEKKTFKGFYHICAWRPSWSCDLWSCKRSPDIWAYCKYKNKFRHFEHCLKMGQGQLSVNHYINFVELENILLHAKFHDHTTISSVGENFWVFTINEHGGHLGHVTYTIYNDFLSYFPRRLHIKFGIDWPIGFKEEDV